MRLFLLLVRSSAFLPPLSCQWFSRYGRRLVTWRCRLQLQSASAGGQSSVAATGIRGAELRASSPASARLPIGLPGQGGACTATVWVPAARAAQVPSCWDASRRASEAPHEVQAPEVVFHLQRCPIGVAGPQTSKQSLPRARDHAVCCRADREHQALHASGRSDEHTVRDRVIRHFRQQIEDLRVCSGLAFPRRPCWKAGGMVNAVVPGF